MEQIFSNNPAVTTPASLTVSRTSLGRQRLSRTGTDGGVASDPSGAEEKVRDSSTGTSPTAAAPRRRLTKHDVGWRRVVRNFSPSWFSVTMGTGIVSILLISIPFATRWLYWLSIVFFALNTVLFGLALAVSVLRYSLYPEIWPAMIRDSTNSLFLATIPMGLATLIEMWVFVCCPVWGAWATTFIWVMWMVDSMLAAAVTLSLSILLISHEEQSSLDRITAAQLLPIAATIVLSGTGAEVAEVLANPQHAVGTVITCYVMWGMACPLAFTVLVMYYQRLAVHKLPPREVIVSCFLPLGPLGMGGYTIMYLGKVSRDLFPKVHLFNNDDVAGEVVYILGFFVALIMWGFGLAWLAFALATIYKCRPFPFNMGWWGFTFPLGVFAVSTIQMGLELPSLTFKVLGTILSVAVILLWIVVAIGTAKGAITGKLFYAPCVANLRPKGDDSESSLASEAGN